MPEKRVTKESTKRRANEAQGETVTLDRFHNSNAMPAKPNPSSDASELRRRAEEKFSARLKAGPTRTNADTQRLVHELQVHQIELEMQNDELQKARDEIEAGLEKYSDLYDFAPVGYMTLDREGTIREANLTSASLLGIERSRLLRQRLGTRCISAADKTVFATFLAMVFESKVSEFCEVSLLKDNQPPVEVRITAMVTASGQECRAVLEEIAGQKRDEANRLALDKLESTKILAEGIAHDFNNLLTVILLDLELAQALPAPDAELEHLLDEAKKATLTASGLTKQIITFAEGSEPVLKPTRLSGVIQEFVQPALSGSQVRCEFWLADDLWPAEVDEAQIGQVIRNLVLNAREAMPQGGVVHIRAENVVFGSRENQSLPPGDYVKLSVADHGGGIAKEMLQKIFDPYFSTKERGNQKGMGLGLTICHTVILRHGGTIAVESEVGAGTTFRIYLPASRNLSVAVKEFVRVSVPRRGRVLVMDDDEHVRKVVGLTLWALGHEVEVAEDGQMAVELYKMANDLRRPFDVVILEYTVRVGMGGVETLQSLLKIDPSVKAIVMSGYTSDPVVLEPERHGFKGVVAKPFDREKLREVLHHIMGSEPGSIAST